jgi:hypothetical protein
VGLLVAVGLVARIRQYAAAASYWYDEAYLLLNIFSRDWLGLLGRLQDDQTGPPLYFWCLRALYLCGSGAEWLMRLPAFVAGLLALGLMTPTARRLVPHAGWLWAVGLCAVCTHAMERGAEVKPYAWDFLATLLILLATSRYLSLTENRRSGGLAGLFALFLLAPWCSLPSVFILGGASLALLAHAACSRSWRAGTAWIGFTLLYLASAGSLYLLVLRQQRTATLVAYWEAMQGDLPSPGRLVVWVGSRLVAIGQYGSNGLGIPLMVLALAGGYLLARRSPPRLLLLAGPVLLALIANLLRCYPLEDRLTFFLAPSVFLLAAESLGRLAQWACSSSCQPWQRWLCLGGATALLLAGVGPTVQLAVFPPPPGFREAMAHAHQHAEEEDLFWVSHPQVHTVYHGDRPRCLGSYDPVEEVVRQAQKRRLWVITAGRSSPGLERALRASGFALQDAHESRLYAARLYSQVVRDRP